MPAGPHGRCTRPRGCPQALGPGVCQSNSSPRQVMVGGLRDRKTQQEGASVSDNRALAGSPHEAEKML